MQSQPIDSGLPISSNIAGDQGAKLPVMQTGRAFLQPPLEPHCCTPPKKKCIRTRYVANNRFQKLDGKPLDRKLTESDIAVINPILTTLLKNQFRDLVSAFDIPFSKTILMTGECYASGQLDYTPLLKTLLADDDTAQTITWSYLVRILGSIDPYASSIITKYGCYLGHTPVFGTDEYLDRPIEESDLPVLADILGHSLKDIKCLSSFFSVNVQSRLMVGSKGRPGSEPLPLPVKQAKELLQQLLRKTHFSGSLSRRVLIDALGHPHVENTAIADTLYAYEEALTRPLCVEDIPAIIELMALTESECKKLFAVMNISLDDCSVDVPSKEYLSKGLALWLNHSEPGITKSLYSLISSLRAAGITRCDIGSKLMDKANLLQRPITAEDVALLEEKLKGIPEKYYKLLVQLGGRYSDLKALELGNQSPKEFLVNGLLQWINQSGFQEAATLSTMYHGLCSKQVGETGLARDILFIDAMAVAPNLEEMDICKTGNVSDRSGLHEEGKLSESNLALLMEHLHDISHKYRPLLKALGIPEEKMNCLGDQFTKFNICSRCLIQGLFQRVVLMNSPLTFDALYQAICSIGELGVASRLKEAFQSSRKLELAEEGSAGNPLLTESDIPKLLLLLDSAVPWWDTLMLHAGLDYSEILSIHTTSVVDISERLRMALELWIKKGGPVKPPRLRHLVDALGAYYGGSKRFEADNLSSKWFKADT